MNDIDRAVSVLMSMGWLALALIGPMIMGSGLVDGWFARSRERRLVFSFFGHAYIENKQSNRLFICCPQSTERIPSVAICPHTKKTHAISVAGQPCETVDV